MALARHVLAEYYGVDRELLDDQVRLEEALRRAAAAAKTTVLKVELHKFAPQGVSGVAILAESHLAIHTWPEHDFASIEIFVCGEDAEPDKGIQVLNEVFQPSQVVTRTLERGDMSLIDAHRAEVSETART